MSIEELQKKLHLYAESHPPKPVRRSAVLVPLLYRGGEPELLFEQRSFLLEHQPGEVCFPGGRVEENETPEEAAVREIKARTAGQAEGQQSKGKVVIATVKGDIHDIGKNIVRLLLENYGFEVTDLGKDVAPETVAEAVERLRAPVCGLSALMTTTVPAMAETVALLHERAPWCRVMVGGAVLTEEYAREIGADGYGKDAMAAVRLAERFMKE